MKSRSKILLLLLVVIFLLIGVMTACNRNVETFTVTFMVDGKVHQTKEVKSGEGLIPPAVPEKEGYKGSWNVQVFTKVIEDMVVLAVYSPIINKITFKAENDNGLMEVVETKSVNYGNSLTAIPEVPERVGYSGVWEITEFDYITSDFEVLAIYTKNSYTIDFVTNGGTKIDGLEMEYQSPVNVSTQRDGYEFVGWFKDAELTIPYELTFVPSENLLLYAKWALIEFTININTQIPEFDTTIRGAYGSTIESIIEYARTGYKFNGWFTDIEYAAPVVFPYTITKNETFYADWIRDNRISATEYTYFLFDEESEELTINPEKTLPLEVIIPSVYDNYVVKRIANNSFKDSQMTSVVIPESIVEIGDFAFATSTLEEVSFDNNSRLKKIGAGAFSNTAIENFELPLNLQHIGHGAFYNSQSLNLSNIFDLQDLLTIGGMAFENTAWYVSQLEGLNDTIFYINNIVYAAIGQLTYFNLLPNTVSISSQAFINQTSITQLAIPDSVRFIGGEYNQNDFDIKGAFYGCSQLEVFQITQASQIEKVGAGAFSGCNTITTVPMSSDLALAQLFGKNNIEYTYSVQYNGEDYYIPTSLSTIKVYGDMPIKPYAFSALSELENIYFYGNPSTISEYAFYNCTSLKRITIPDSVTEIADYAFSGCLNIRNFIISDNNSIEKIGDFAFENLNNAYFIVDSFVNLKIVGDNAFKNCYYLTEFIAPIIESVGVEVFFGCKLLETITVPTSLSTVHILFENNLQSLPNFYSVEGYQIPIRLKTVNIVFVENYTIIADSFLEDFSSLNNITIQEGITIIGEYAFVDTDLFTISIPDSVEYIYSSAFAGNENLTNVNITASSQLKHISSGTFSNCVKLESIFIPKLVENLGLSAFSGCTKLQSISVHDENEYYYSYEGVLYSDDTILYYPPNKPEQTYTMKEGTKYIAENAFLSSSKLSNLIYSEQFISSHINAFNDCEFDSITVYSDNYSLSQFYHNIEEVGLVILKGNSVVAEFAKGSKIKNVEISEGITTIGESAFQDCEQLVSAVIPATIIEIGTYAFDNCMQLVTITFSNFDALETIYESAFEKTKWYDGLENGVIYIGNIAYGYKGEMADDTELDIAEGVTAIADNAFKSYTKITSVTFPSTLNMIGKNAFEGATGLTELNFNESLTIIDDYAFADCENLTSVNFPDTLEYIGDNSFYNASSLDGIAFNEGLLFIGESAFQNNNSLSLITIPSTVEEIRSFAFSDCADLLTIEFSNIDNLVEFGKEVFHGTLWYTNLSVSNEYLYLENDVLYSYVGTASNLNIAGNISRIMSYAFAANQYLTDINIPASVNKIDKYAFVECKLLRNVTFTPNGQLTEIGDYAFRDCKELQNFYIPFNLKSFSRTVLEGCSSLQWINIENEEINSNFSFYNGILYNGDRTKIVYVPMTISGTVTIEETVTEIPDYVFENKALITTVIFHNGIERIGEGAFKGCEQLSEIIFGSNSMLNYIGKESFYGCVLYNIILPRRVSYIGKDAFYNSAIETARYITLQSSTPPTIVDLQADAFSFIVPRNSLSLYKVGQKAINSNYIYPSKVLVEFVVNNKVYSVTEIICGDKITSVPDVPEIIGYIGDWKEEELEIVRKNGEFIRIFDDIRINAIYTEIEYEINYYDENENLIEDKAQKYIYNQQISLEQYQQDGKQFVYWTDDLNALVPFNLLRMPTNNINLYAVMYEFSFDYNETSDSYAVGAGQNNVVTPQNIILPAEYNGKAVTSIAEEAFAWNTHIDTVSLSDTIRYINYQAFYMSSIKNVIISEQSQLSEIAGWAFCQSDLEQINFPDELSLIGDFAFKSTNLVQLDIIIDISNIGEFAFADCQLQTVNIQSPSSVMEDIDSISQSIFYDNSSLISVYLPEELTVIGKRFFENCSSLADIDTSNIESIELRAFANCISLEYINLQTANIIAYNAFNGCINLRNIDFENNNSLNYIGQNAFQNCNSLFYFIVPATTKEIHNDAFIGCDNLQYIVILENGNTNDGSLGLTLTGNVVEQNVDIYVNRELQSNQAKWSPNNVYLYIDIINNFVINEDKEIILYIGLDNEIIIPQTVESELIEGIDVNTFKGSEHLTKVTLVNQDIVNNLEYSIFYHLINLEQIISPKAINGVLYNDDYSCLIAYPAQKSNSVFEIAKNVIKISDYAFYGADLLDSVVLKPLSPPQIDLNTFENINDNLKFYVPATAINEYKNAAVWSNYADRIYPDYIEYNDFLLIDHDEGLEISQYIGEQETIFIPLSINGRNVVAIGDYAFYGTSIKSISNLANIKYIGQYAFANCTALEYINLQSIISIANYAFYGCENLKLIDFQNNGKLNYIGEGAFQNCKNLIYFVVPATTKTISNNAFIGCDNLQYIIILENGKDEDGSSGISLGVNVVELSVDVYVNDILGLNQIKWSPNSVFLYKDIINDFIINIDNEIILYIGPDSNVTIPEKVGDDYIIGIAPNTFIGAQKLLESITLKSLVPPQIGLNTFENLNDNYRFYVPSKFIDEENEVKVIDQYKNAAVWSNYADRIYTEYIEYNDFLLIDHAEGLEISQYIGNDETTNIPISLNGKNIVAIGDYAFYRSSINSISIPTNIKYIGQYAFAQSNLESIYLSSNVRTIGEYAFADCINFVNFSFNSTLQLEELKAYTFKGNVSLTAITIPNNVAKIGDRVFEDCAALTNVVINSNSKLISIGEYAFNNCVSLIDIDIEKCKNLLTIDNYAFQNCSGLINITIPESLTSIKNYAFNNCVSLENLYFIGLSKLNEIGDYAFIGCNNLKKLTVPLNVTRIGERAFYNNNLSQIIFLSGSKIHEIGSYAFANSSSIKQIELFGSANIIREGAFLNSPNLRWMKVHSELPPTLENNVWDTKLRIYVPEASINNYKQQWTMYSSGINSLSRIAGDYSYINYGLGIEIFQYMGVETDIEIPQILNGNEVLSIGSFAFNNEIESIIIPQSVIALKASAFNTTKIQSIILHRYIELIENNPFTNCTYLEQIIVEQQNPYFTTLNGVLLTKDLSKLIAYPNAMTTFDYIYTVPTQVRDIGIEAFMGANNLASIDIPDTIRTIGKNAFMDCSKLSNISFSNATIIDSIGERAFDGTLWYQNKNYGVVYINSTNPSVNGLTVYGYKGELNGDNEIVVDNDAVSILPYAFKNLSSLLYIQIPSSVNYIGESILVGCSNLTEVVIPGNYILGYLFGTQSFANTYQVYNNQKETTYYVPSSLTQVSIAQNSDKIIDYAFNNTHSIITVNIPNSVIYIGRYAFYSETSEMNLENVLFEDIFFSSLEVIGSYSFRNCTRIVTLELPNNLHTINSYAFENNSRLANVSLENTFGDAYSNLNYIGNNAFANCTRLIAINIPSKVKYVSAKAFYNCIDLVTVNFDAQNGELLEIGNQAFMNCTDLAYIETPSKLSRIGDRAFYNCITLGTFNYVKSSESLEYMGYEVFHQTPYYEMLLSRPENLNGIIYFSKVAYAYNGMISSGSLIEIRSNTVSLSPYLFANRSNIYYIASQSEGSVDYTTVLLNSTLKIIGRNAFANNSNLYGVTLPDSLTTIESDAFRNCNFLTDVAFDDDQSLEHIGQNAFYNVPWYNNLYNNLENNTILYIGNVAYKYKGIMTTNTEIVLRENTVSITPYAFENHQGMISIKIPDTIKSINQFVFGNHLNMDNASLQTIYIDKDALSINNVAGIFTSASKVILNANPDSIKLKGTCQFTYEVTEDGDIVVVTETIDIMDLLIILKENESLPQIYVPQQYYEEYLFADGWSDLTRYIVPFVGIFDDFVIAQSNDDDGVDIVYYAGDSLELVIPDNINDKPVVGIRSYAFNTSIQKITLSNTSKYIYDYAFANNLSLAEINLPITLEMIGNYAFVDCVSLTSLNIPQKVQSIGKYAFYRCSLLNEVTLEPGIKEIAEYAFAECASLESITIPYTVEFMGNYIFNECASLQVLIMKGNTPPVLGTSGLYYRSDIVIFVNDEAYGTYIDNFYWKRYLNRTQNMSSLINYLSTQEIYIHNLADLLVDGKGYYNGQKAQLNITINPTYLIYIADNDLLTYEQLTNNYTVCNINNNTVRMPSTKGQYTVYVVINNQIVSIGKNIVNIDELIDEETYLCNQEVEMNFVMSDGNNVYIAPAGLNFAELTTNYQKANVVGSLINMPDQAGEYRVYIASNNEIISIGNNVITVI